MDRYRLLLFSRPHCIWLWLLLIISFVRICKAQEPVFRVTRLKGSAQVQRSGETEWKKIKIGQEVKDNDILRSQFQTQLSLTFGRGNIVSLGSNSKILLNIELEQSQPQSRLATSITLLNGGVLAQALNRAHINIYTSNAVAETDSGLISAVLEEKSGKTGFQLLQGSASTRNIAQKKATRLVKGQTTMILPGKEPTAPLYITNQHVQVMKKFFGNQYVQQKIDEADITPTTSYQSRLQFKGKERKKARTDAHLQKRQFSLNQAYNHIVNQQKQDAYSYHTIRKTHTIDTSSPISVGVRALPAIALSGFYPQIGLLGCVQNNALTLEAAIDMHTDVQGSGLYQFSSINGICALITRLSTEYIRPDSQMTVNIQAGHLMDITFGRGALVHRYSNDNNYTVMHPCGLAGEVALHNARFRALIGDIASLNHAGVHAAYSLEGYTAGAGYLFDLNTYSELDASGNSRFFASETIRHDTASQIQHFLSYNFSVDIMHTYTHHIEVYGGFAQRLGSSSVIGYVCNVPGISVKWRTFRFDGGLVAESGKLVHGQFGHAYPTLRGVFDTTFSNAVAYSYYTDALSRSRRSSGLRLGYSQLIGNHIDIETGLTAYISNHNTWKKDTLNDTLSFTNTKLYVRAAIDDSLLPGIAYACFTFRSLHGGLFPAGGSLFNAYNSSVEFSITTKPLAYNLYFQGGIDVRFVDIYNQDGEFGAPNKRIDPPDFFTTLRFAIVKGLL